MSARNSAVHQSMPPALRPARYAGLRAKRQKGNGVEAMRASHGRGRGHPLVSVSSEARPAYSFFSVFSSPRALSRAAPPAATTAAVAVFFATSLSFDTGVRTTVFFDLDNVLALAVFL